MSLYPLKFKPILKDKIWGGSRLSSKSKKGDDARIGESWEISGLIGEESVVSEGYLKDNNINELIEVYMTELVGERIYDEFGNEFPLILKLIDAKEDLSIQVHPDNEMAIKRHNCFGKTEMWYVCEAQENTSLVWGFEKDTNQEDYIKHLKNGTLEEILHFEPVRKGDVFYTPAGKVHAIGKGALIAEIHQSSDITYRIYDYNRIDKNGEKRDLHTDLALDCIDFHGNKDSKTHPEVEIGKPQNIVTSEFFTTNLLKFNSKIGRDYYALDSFVAYMCTEGSFDILYDEGKVSVKKGESVLIPACLNEIFLNPTSKEVVEILEVYIEK